MIRRILIVAALGAASIAAFAGLQGAEASPAKSPRSEIITLNCGSHGTIEILVFSNGAFSPGFPVDGGLLIPVAVDTEGSFTDPEGNVQPFEEHASHNAPRHADVFTCTFHAEGSDEFGSFVVDGTADVYRVR